VLCKTTVIESPRRTVSERPLSPSERFTSAGRVTPTVVVDTLDPVVAVDGVVVAVVGVEVVIAPWVLLVLATVVTLTTPVLLVDAATVWPLAQAAVNTETVNPKRAPATKWRRRAAQRLVTRPF
jgi:hypothetical protein